MDHSSVPNPEDWFGSLPPDIAAQAIDLSPYGINDQAFPLRVALDALDELRGKRWVVYGGDFYRKAASGRWQPTYESWYAQHQASEPIPVFIERSIDAAIAAISKVRVRLGEGAGGERVVLTAAKPRPGDLARSWYRPGDE